MARGIYYPKNRGNDGNSVRFENQVLQRGVKMFHGVMETL
jgi:hypothetical protein